MEISLHDIVVAHQQWLTSGGQDGKRANFRGVNLSGQIFAGFNLTQASFRNANLSNCQFIECVLDEADFAEATGPGVQFQGCQMKAGNFARAHLPNARFEQCHMQKAVFLQSRFDSVRFADVRLQESNFREAVCPNMQMIRVEWRKSTLRSLAAQHGYFSEVRFDGIDGKEANFNQGRFETAAWYGAYLRDATFENASMEESDLTTAEEVDALAVTAAERTQNAQRQEEMRALERQRSMVLELQHALTRREEILKQQQEALQAFQRHVENEQIEMRQRASTMRLYAAGWFMITAMIFIMILDKVTKAGIENVNVLELALVGLGALFILLLHLGAATLSYRISRQLWRLVDEKEQLDSTEE